MKAEEIEVELAGGKPIRITIQEVQHTVVKVVRMWRKLMWQNKWHHYATVVLKRSDQIETAPPVRRKIYRDEATNRWFCPQTL